jgi:hypothetical protein
MISKAWDFEKMEDTSGIRLETLQNSSKKRKVGVSWIDSQDKLWLLGGVSWDSVGNYAGLNDLWHCTR